jgi:integrase
MRIPKYRKHSTRDFGFAEYRGKRIRFRGRYKSRESIAEYHEFVAKAQREAVEPRLPPPSAPGVMSVAELCGRFIRHAEQRYAAGGKRGEFQQMRLAVDHLVRWGTFGSLRVVDFTPLRLAEYRDRLANRRRKPLKGAPDEERPTLKRGYVNSMLVRVKMIFKWGVSQEMVPVDTWRALTAVEPLRRFKSTATEPVKKKPARPRDFVPIRKFVSPTIWTMILVQHYTGARGDSVCNMKPEQIDRTRTPWIWKAKHKGDARGIDLTIHIGPRCRKHLEPFLAKCKPGQYVFRPRAVRECVRYRDHYDSQSYRQAVKHGIAKCNTARVARGRKPIREFRPHELRHGRGHFIRANFNLEATAAVLGHRSLRVSQIYSERRLDLAVKVAESTG